jgi:hypothetical protein
MVTVMGASFVENGWIILIEVRPTTNTVFSKAVVLSEAKDLIAAGQRQWPSIFRHEFDRRRNDLRRDASLRSAWHALPKRPRTVSLPNAPFVIGSRLGYDDAARPDSPSFG